MGCKRQQNDICLPQIGDTQMCPIIRYGREKVRNKLSWIIRPCDFGSSKFWDDPNWFSHVSSDDFGHCQWKCDHISFWHALLSCPTSKASHLTLWAFCLKHPQSNFVRNVQMPRPSCQSSPLPTCHLPASHVVDVECVGTIQRCRTAWRWWLSLVGGIPTPRKNMNIDWDDEIPIRGKNMGKI